MTMPRESRLCLQAEVIVNRVYNYFPQLQRLGAGSCALKEDIGRHKFMRSIHSSALLLKAFQPTYYVCIRIAERMITSIWQQDSGGSTVFSSPPNWCKVGSSRVLVGTSDREAIKRRMYQLYERKVHVTVKKRWVYSPVQISVNV